MVEERNDWLKRGANIPKSRYEWAALMLGRNKLIGDLGCGMGGGSKILRDAQNRVIGVDNSPEAVEYAKFEYKGDYLVGDMDKDDFNIFNFDAVVCLEALCHIVDPARFLHKLNVPEIVVSAPIDPNPNDGYHFRKHHLSEEKFKKMLYKWEIVDELWQKVGPGENYLVIYAKKSSDKR